MRILQTLRQRRDQYWEQQAQIDASDADFCRRMGCGWQSYEAERLTNILEGDDG